MGRDATVHNYVYLERDILAPALKILHVYLLRYERAELIADESVENSSRLLSVNKVHIDFFGACLLYTSQKEAQWRKVPFQRRRAS